MSPRRNKEASVAGESPDKSEQRKSSGTAEERDPRFAVFREPVAAAGTGSTTGRTTGTVTDTATAVFRSPLSADPAGDPDEESEDVSADVSREGSVDAESETGADRADTATASGSGPEGPEAPTEGSEAPEGGSTGRGAPGGPAGTAGADEAARGEAGAKPAADAAPAAGADPEVDADADADTGTDAVAAAGPSGASGSDADAAVEGGSGPATASGPNVKGESDEAPDAPDAPETDGDAEGGARAESDDDRDDQDEPGAETADAAGSGDALARATDVDRGATGDDETADGGKTDDGKAAKASDVEESTGPKATAEPADDKAAETKADEPAVAKPVGAKAADTKPGDTKPGGPAGGKPVGSSDAPRVPKTRTETSAGEPAAEVAATPTAETAPEAAAEDSEPTGDKRGVDQPTTAFKALAPKRVDQPTTALKLPPREPERKSDPETPAERTSTFVPLRSDDIRPAPKAGEAAGASASPVGPTVTPDITAKPGAPKTSATPAAGLVEAERTRQQPMPPKPPLDLLAELTNTPPPRQTPVRTVFRRVKIWTPLVLLLVVVFAIAQAVRPLPEPALVLSADPTYTFGGEKLDMPWPAEGQGAVEVEGVGTIGSYGTEKSAPIASVAKIMTAYVILQGHPITGKQDGEEIVVDETAGEEANRPDESTAPIKEGQKYTQRQMLQLLMIPSGNNVARLLARWDAKTVDAFVGKMNAAAKDLGMTKSVYTDPSGLEATTRSTPADQLKLAKAVTRNDVFREIVNMPQADIPGIGKTIYNNNVILLEDGVNGIKTGSSTPAGGNLVWTADTVIDGKNRRIIGAVMGADLDGTLDAKLQRAIQNSLKLIKAAQKGVESATVVKKGQVVGYVDNGLGGRTPVVSTKDLKAVGWGGLEVDLKMTDGGTTPAQAAEAGTVVGEVTVGTGTGKVSAPVALRSEMTEPAFGDKLTRIT
ncbi:MULTISPECIES: D-alanyl-D-alanine carboxypeptidase [Streptomyces]|uniref:D-alanyl-D-alanine carboxypeptidase n=1 Tax=Streptomyces clavifer TaxID=68188 RepID=A0ABS4VAB5_9ACTN|nr:MULTISPECIES: D-alanyl-D-alanine carboxypeptidase [Streptomyces]MBP2360773.1 D-alanyl-D-alanine carboxypeptidase [Streptomyces clavifer]MDX2746053.1 D-alanyl-D-alanine carboxypeptidase [Streptomyces sp. NRRL_B-2557]GHB11969.1 D-alanyl-D-alanine carboxypeptidase [Streptomyces clavifer]